VSRPELRLIKTRKLWYDFETFSDVELKKSNAYRYCESDVFEALMCGWSTDGINFAVAVGEPEILRIPGLGDPSVVHVAHNAAFERLVTSRILGMPFGQYLPPEMFDDTQARAAEHGYPQSLDMLAKRLRCTPKDTAGTRLIRLFCVPNRDGSRNTAETHPAEWAQFVAYCRQDAETLVEVDDKLPDFPTELEREAWCVDQRINDRGVRVDLDLARLAVAADSVNAIAAKVRIHDLAGIVNPNSVPQMKAWINDCALGLPNLKAATIEAAMLTPGRLSDTEREVLELRADLALASSSKYTAVLAGVSADGRLRGQFKFGGAHTLRWSGKGVQLHNLPRAGFADLVDKDEVKAWFPAEEVDAEITRRANTLMEAALADLHLGFGADPRTLKMLVRPTLYVDGPNVDYASIEARIIAWVAGEEWALKAFRDNRDIYVETANLMSTAHKSYNRAQGKVAVLALGFNGAVNSLRNMGATGDDEELLGIVTQWRRTNRKIVKLWYDLGDAIREGGRIGKHIRVERRGGIMLIWLPSGRALTYHDVRWESYHVEDPVTGRLIPKKGWRYANPKGPGRIGSYGGKLAENLTQAIARDYLAHGLVELDRAGYPVVLHVHDEAGVEGPHDVEDVARIMCAPPEWAEGLPMAAEGSIKTRYSK
jgi:DNA polymerase